MKTPVRQVIASTLFLIASCSQDPKAQRDKYFNEAQQYLANDRYGEANVQFRNALQMDERHIPSYMGLAEMFKKTGEDDAAINMYRKVVNLDPENVAARIEIGRYFLGAAAETPNLFRTVETIAREALTLDPSNVEARVLLGNAYSGSGDIEKSVQELKTAVSQDPEHLQATISLGAAQLRTGNRAEAEQHFKSALRQHPDSLEAMLGMAAFLAGTQRSEEAETFFKRAFDLFPADPRSLTGLTSFYRSTNRGSQVENTFKRAILRKPEAREPYWGLANYYLQQGAPDAAMSALVDLLKIKPGDRPAQVRLAELYVNSSQPAKAQDMVQSVLAAAPNDALALALQGRLSRERSEFEKAATEFDAAIMSDGALIPPYIEKANLQMGGGHLDGAAETLTLALQRDKNNLLARGFLAKILALQQKPQDAIREATIVLQATPNNEDAIVARADAFLSLGNPEEASKQFRRLTELRPRYAFYWHRLAMAEAMRGNSIDAIAHLRKAVELKPDLKAAIHDLILLHVRNRQFDAALSDLDRLRRTSLAEDEIHRLRGEVLRSKGDIATAEVEFRKAIAQNPAGYANYIALAEMSLEHGDLVRAMQEIDQWIAKDNRAPQAFFMKAYFLQLQNDRAGAVANYRQALERDPKNPDTANNLAWLLAEDSQYLGEALTLAETARRIRPADPEFADTLGQVHYNMKNYRLAVDQFLFSINNRPQPRAEHYFRLGLAYHAKGDAQNGHRMLRKALQTDPAFPGTSEAKRILEKDGA